MRLTLDLNDLHKINMYNRFDVVKWSDDGKLFMHPPGHQHYMLLSYISTLIPDGSTVLEIGTRWGVSAVALSTNPNIKVVTCDLEDQIANKPDIPNIEYLIKDGYELLDKHKDDPVMFIDVDPHDGVQERKMINKLIELDYRGILLLDDIHLNEKMNEFWNWIPLKKFDLTKIGHYSGSGAVLFGDSEIVIS